MRQKGFVLVPLLFLLFAVVVVGTICSQNIRVKNNQTNTTTPVQEKNGEIPILPINTPTSSPLVKYKIGSERQTITIKIPKYSDSTNEKVDYQITFARVSPDSMYSITNDIPQKLMISDSSYEFVVSLPQDGGSNIFKKIPPITTISTNQFGKVYQIKNPHLYDDDQNNPYGNDIIHLVYTNDYNENCTQWTPKPAACSLMQIEYSNTKSNLEKSYVYASCTTSSEAGISLCDKIITSLEIKQLH